MEWVGGVWYRLKEKSIGRLSQDNERFGRLNFVVNSASLNMWEH